MNSERLKESCQYKNLEAEERYQYVSLFLGETLTASIREKIDQAKGAAEKQEYELCLILSAQSKAEADAILGSMGINDDNIDEFIESKKKAVERVLAENIADGVFPILGYSYYQYADSLKTIEKYNALVYYEYALEMSDLSIYFPEEKTFFQQVQTVQVAEKWWYLLAGLGIGAVIAGLVFLLIGVGKKKPKLKFVKKNTTPQ